MIEEGKISVKQVILLVMVMISSTAILYLPALIYQNSEQNGWISTVMLVPFGIFVGLIIVKLGLTFPDMTIVQYSEKLVGKILGKVIGLLYIIFFIHINSVVIREFVEFLAGVFFPKTPPIFFVITIIIPSIYLTWYGLEVLARVNEFLFPLFLITIIGIIILSIGNMEIKNFFPIMYGGIKTIYGGFFPQVIWFAEIVILAMLLPYLNTLKGVTKIPILSIVAVGLLGLITNIAIVGVFGDETGFLSYPFHYMARYVSVYEIIERLDSLVMFMWVAGVFLKIGLLHYLATLSLAQWLRVKNYRPLVIPIGVVLVIISLIQWDDLSQLMFGIKKLYPIPYLAMEVGIPLMLFVILKFKEIGGKI